MNPVEQLALGVQALWFTLREFARGRTWLPFVALFAAQCFGLVLLSNAAHPLLSPLLAPLVTRLAGAGALHYPQLFLHLPDLALSVDVFVVATLGALATGAATRLFARVFEGREPDLAEAWRETIARAPALIVAQLPVTLLVVGLGAALDAAAQARISSITRGLLPTAGLVLGTVVQALFAYVPALVMLARCGPVSAWRLLPRLWGRGLIPGLVVFALVTLLLVPVQTLAQASAAIVARGLPELTMATAALMFVGAGIVSWWASGAATLVWMSALAGLGERES